MQNNTCHQSTFVRFASIRKVEPLAQKNLQVLKQNWESRLIPRLGSNLPLVQHLAEIFRFDYHNYRYAKQERSKKQNISQG